MKKKIVFIGDTNSINVELIHSSHQFLKNKVKYFCLGNLNETEKYLNKLKSKININQILDPFSLKNYKKDCINFFNIDDVSREKYKNLLNQINIANQLANFSKTDLVTLPINKSLFKKKTQFVGMTEYLARINKKDTFMLMHGEKFSIIPLTTHINLKSVNKFIKIDYLKKSIKKIIIQINRDNYNLNIKTIKFLCYNPHCGEDNTIGKEDRIISNSISNFKEITGSFSADSAFKNLSSNNTMFISMYHDQALIPFKILNKKGINLTLGLNYRRLSPAHGTATDIKFKNISNNSSYVACMQY